MHDQWPNHVREEEPPYGEMHISGTRSIAECRSNPPLSSALSSQQFTEASLANLVDDSDRSFLLLVNACEHHRKQETQENATASDRAASVSLQKDSLQPTPNPPKATFMPASLIKGSRRPGSWSEYDFEHRSQKSSLPCSDRPNAARRRVFQRSDSDVAGFASPDGPRSMYRRHTTALIDCLDGLLKTAASGSTVVRKDEVSAPASGEVSGRGRREKLGSRESNCKSRPRNIVLKQAVDLIWKIQCDEQAFALCAAGPPCLPAPQALYDTPQAAAAAAAASLPPLSSLRNSLLGGSSPAGGGSARFSAFSAAAGLATPTPTRASSAPPAALRPNSCSPGPPPPPPKADPATRPPPEADSDLAALEGRGKGSAGGEEAVVEAGPARGVAGGEKEPGPGEAGGGGPAAAAGTAAGGPGAA